MTAVTVEMDNAGFDELKSQLSEGMSSKATNRDGDIRDKLSDQASSATKPEKESKKTTGTRKSVFTKGDQSVELDDDYEFEMMADKRPVKLSLRELKDRAAGDIAIKNRMHSLAEEKKRVQSTFKEFARLAKNDPLGALEYISNQAKEADGEFEYNQYIEKLAEQAENLGKMNDSERKAHELDKKLKKAEQDLSQKERQQAVVLRKQEMLSDYPGIGESEFSSMVEAVLSNDDILADAKDETDVMDKVEELIQETLTQRDIMSVIRDIDPSYLNDNELIFSLSDQLRFNPDLNEDDVRDIVRELITPKERIKSPQSKERDRDQRILSHKQRASMGIQSVEQSNDPYELLKAQLLEKQDEIRKTPKNKR